ncbi:MAG: carbonic anhydrase family protein, partial [Rhodoferax sp.]
MKRTLIEAFLAVALVGAAVFGWTNWKGNASAQAKVSELQVAAEEAGKKAKEAEESIQSSKDAVAAEREEMAAIQVKSQQLDAVKASLASGTVLSDLEAAYKTQKSLSADRQLGLGALRMLTKGSSDPAAVEAFQKALEISEWGSRKNTICAAQIALAATGQKTEVMAGCLAGKEGAKGEHAASAHAAPETHAPADAHAAPAASAAPADAHAAAPAAAKSDGHKPSDPHAAPHWTYAGAQGPDRWGMDFPTCGKGQSQAPIDIVGPFVKGKMTVTADYKAGPLKVLNNGHTIQVNVPGGSKLRVDGVAYELIQFHFHRPSEDRIDGKPMDMVAHFVHKNAAGNLVVLSLLLR